MSFIHTIQQYPCLHTALVAVRDAGNRVLSYPFFLLERMRPRREGPTRVVFIVEMPSVWNKALPTYRRMFADPDFEPMILCLPSSLEGCFERENETYRYFVEAGYSNVLNAVQGKAWLNPKTLHADYFVILRPYDNYRPRPYKSIHLCRFGKICVILYATLMSTNLIPEIVNRRFFSQVSWFFAESEYVRDHNIRQNYLKNRTGLQHSVYIGIPAVESMLDAKNRPAASWSFSCNTFRAIWTPRWSTDTFGGGSNFLRYQQDFISFFSQHRDMDLLLRPHPLMFRHLLDSGIMTQDEIDAVYALFDQAENLSLDREKEYFPTFWNSDVLISDISSIIPEYFITGNPVIFCRSPGIDWKTIPIFEEMLNACYCADTFEEIGRILVDLQHGHDPLKKARADLAARLFLPGELPSELIIDTLRRK